MVKLTLLCLFITFVFAQAPNDPIADFCRLYGHQTAVIDRKFYIDGGWSYANPISANPSPTISTISSYDSSPHTDLEIDQDLFYGDLDIENAYNFPTINANLTKNVSVPDVSGGILWADEVNKVFWLYGGEFSGVPSTFQLWGYDVVMNQWNLSTTASNSVQRVSYGAGTTVNDLGKGFYYGGYLNKYNTPSWPGSPYATNSLVVFDMDQNTLTNMTGPVDGIGRAEGVMVSIPASASGMLIYFGGVAFPNDTQTAQPQSMEYVILYDIADQKWYKQRTTGDIPANRRHFCGGVTWADDKSSYNVYIYGGLGFGENSTGFDDLYILTMPTFQWIKWYPDTADSTPRPHGFASCNVIDNSQMIVMGGNFSADTDCDATNVFGMHNVNLGQEDATDAKWYRYLPNVTTYAVPSAIISAVGGSSTGGASKTTPITGWDDSALAVYFGEKAQYQTRTPTRSLPGATNSPNHQKDSGKHIGIIVGAAVGGLVVILAAMALFFCCCYRRRRFQHKAPKPQADAVISTGPPELSGISHYDYKPLSTAQVVSSPTRTQSTDTPVYSSSPPLPSAVAPVYLYQPPYALQNHGPPQLYPQFSPQPQYSPYPQMYTVVPYPSDATSPPEGWTMHPHQQQQQQYFPPMTLDPRRMSPPAQEMPTATSPHPSLNRSATLGEGGGPVYSLPPGGSADRRSASSRIKRREVGSASSPTTATATTETQSEAERFV